MTGKMPVTFSGAAEHSTAWIQRADLSRNLLLMESFAEGVVEPAKACEIVVVEQFHDPRLFLQRCGYDDEEIPARSHDRQARFDILADRVQLQRRQEAVIERRLGEAAQQGAPVIVRPERMVGHRIVVFVPPIGEFPIESRHCFVGPRPVAE
jgi:hypothetical protein